MFNQLAQVLVRGGYHATVHFHGTVGAHWQNFAFRQHPQQPGLELQGHIPDFVQEQCPTIRLLDHSPHSSGPRTGKRARHVPEKLALDQ